MTRPAPRPLAVLALLALSPWGAARGTEPAPPASLLVTAAELPRLADRAVELPAGRYTVKVWASARQTWALEARGETVVLTVTAHRDGDAPRWQTVGAADLPARIVLARPAPAPALLSLSTDPSFDPAPALDLVRGRTDSVDPPADPRRSHSRTNQQGADFRPPATVQAWRDRARAVREQLLVTLGLWPMPPRTPLHPRVFGKVERDGYTIEKVVLETFPGFTLSGNLYRPVGQPGRRPLVLCPHGHWPEGRVNTDVQSRCVRWAKLGCVVFLYDMVGYADGKPFGHAFLNDRLRRWGLSLVTLQTWDSLRALDWLTGLPDVDPARVGCTGESGGGTQTFLLTAVDDRVKVAAPVVMVSDSFQGGCVCENCAGLRIGTDNVEFAALAAPRPLKLVGATGDWTKLTMSRAYPTLRDVYALCGTTDRLSAEVFDFPHNYNQTSRNAVYAFMAKWLLGVDDPSRTREGEQAVEKPDDLYTFRDSNPAPADRKTPAGLEADLVRTLTRQLDALAPAASPAAWEASRGLLRTALRVRVGLVNPTPAEVDHREVRQLTRDGLTVTHSLVGRKAVGDQVPVVRLTPARPTGRLTVIATPRGKAGLVDPDGRPGALARALLQRGQSVVGFDPLFVGESVDPSAPAARRPETAHFDTYNPTPAADQMQDLATVLAWARSRPDVREVSVIGGAQVLIARPLLEGLARTAVDLHGFDPGDGSAAIPPELDLPGLLQFGGLKAAAALAAPAPLRLFRPGPAFDRSWPETSYALADASHALRIEPGRAAPEDLARWVDQGD